MTDKSDSLQDEKSLALVAVYRLLIQKAAEHQQLDSQYAVSGIIPGKGDREDVIPDTGHLVGLNRSDQQTHINFKVNNE